MSRLFAITGPRGYTGSVGERGPIGPTGERGETGRAGPTGPRGFVGEAGPTGPRGVPGRATMTGARGAPGPTGARGEMGERGHTGIMGPTGIRGPTGERGEIGERGPTGQRGIDGIATNTGATGPQGIQGPTGSAGAQGVQGVQGPTGPQGVQGPTGSQGIQGVQGEMGPTGPQGVQGPTGSQGIQGVGITGPTGSVGIQGIQGPTGSTGRTGPAGIQGPTGPQGIQGPAGPAGTGSGGGMSITTENATGTVSTSTTVSFLSSGTTYTLGNGTTGGQMKYLIVSSNPYTWSWTKTNLGFSDMNRYIKSMAIFNNLLFVGTNEGYVYTWNGANWALEATFGGAVNAMYRFDTYIWLAVDIGSATEIRRRDASGVYSLFGTIYGGGQSTDIVGDVGNFTMVYFRTPTTQSDIWAFSSFYLSSFRPQTSLDSLIKNIPISPRKVIKMGISYIIGGSNMYDSNAGILYRGLGSVGSSSVIYNANGLIRGIYRLTDYKYYVYGDFTQINGVTARGIVLYTISETEYLNYSLDTFTPLGGGVSGSVYAVTVLGNDIYVAGSFTGAYNTSGGSMLSISKLAVWNEQKGWRDIDSVAPIGDGTSTMITYNEYAIAGGSFTHTYDSNGNVGIAGFKDNGISYSPIDINGSYLNPNNIIKLQLGPPGDSAHLIWNASLSKWCVISPTK